MLFSQIGINMVSPNATLDVVAKKTDGSTAEGAIFPRLTGDQIKAADAQYSTAQKGALVYVTNPVTSTSPKTANVTIEGYYYFDGNLWQRLMKAPFYYQKFILTGSQDNVGNFNTNISASDYTVVVVNALFNKALVKNASQTPQPPLTSIMHPNVYALVNNGRWVLKADYSDMTTSDNTNGTWTIYTLIMNKGQVIQGQDITAADGNYTGSYSPPIP